MTELARKLGIKPGARVALVAAPDGFELEVPDGVQVVRSLRGRFDVVLWFGVRERTLSRRLPALVRALEVDGGLWLCWPKRSSGVASDLGDDPVRRLGLAAGLVDNKVCAVDETWSALRFVYRLADRPRVTSG